MCPKSPYHAYLNGSDNEDEVDDDSMKKKLFVFADQAVWEAEEELKAESFERSLNVTEERASPMQ